MQLESPHILVTLFAFLMLLGTLVIVHELGHYWVGRWFGVKAEKFSIGFGPQLWGRVDKRGTLWRVAALPLGGYVQFAGDMNPASQPDEAWHNLPDVERNQTFQSKALWKRALIVFAGPAVNFLLAIAILTGFVAIYGQSVAPPVVQAVVEGSAAEKMGLKPGDRIQSIAGVSIDSFQDLAAEVSIHGGDTVPITYVRNGVSLSKDITVGIIEEKDRFGNRYKRGMLGLPFPPLEVREVSLFEAPFIAVRETANIVRLTVKTLGQIITGRRPISELGGPLKIAKVSGEQFVLGFAAFLWLTAMISINLGFINLLPIPMLDGGHLLLYGIEAVRRRPATPMVQEWAFRAGFAVLLGFMLMVTFNDLASFGLFGE
ncbi:RIP metalloprotease RseP [Sphingorhabdus sp.]|jgi:regulator of sigma E protease|uniref:RIP metalloprotease RseP n=1 Tax=Sphingorhabdus sp. TaxID=1902408 RepID=UPI003BAFF8CF|nr:RIP metalloprotease RseP [Sphingomonadales bacterium]MBK9433205.1 RIP metalloprotease RseP [Sphingomonadales bacterium]MBL0022264.1 RIP metalloprotease RseP [Sphingomonadales bacterium]